MQAVLVSSPHNSAAEFTVFNKPMEKLVRWLLEQGEGCMLGALPPLYNNDDRMQIQNSNSNPSTMMLVQRGRREGRRTMRRTSGGACTTR